TGLRAGPNRAGGEGWGRTHDGETCRHEAERDAEGPRIRWPTARGFESLPQVRPGRTGTDSGERHGLNNCPKGHAPAKKPWLASGALRGAGIWFPSRSLHAASAREGEMAGRPCESESTNSIYPRRLLTAIDATSPNRAFLRELMCKTVHVFCVLVR